MILETLIKPVPILTKKWAKKIIDIITSSTVMRSAPTEMSSLETECLFGEKVEILDKHLDWVFCKLKTDNYCGWVQKNG